MPILGKPSKYPMKRILLFLCLSLLILASSCKKKEIQGLNNEISIKNDQIAQLEQQLTHLQKTNGSLLDRMSDMSIINKAGAESIQQSLENMSEQYSFIQDLTKKMQSKDSLNLALVLNLKRSLADINDEDVQVEVRGGIVYVSISDKLLFTSGSSKLNQRARKVLGKIASVINDHKELEILVEGHTDNIPMANECISDNWDLSVKRATTVVRVLQTEYLVNPERITAAGRSEYLPKEDNSTPVGRSKNRRTEIIITPRLDQFFNLMAPPTLVN